MFVTALDKYNIFQFGHSPQIGLRYRINSNRQLLVSHLNYVVK